MFKKTAITLSLAMVAGTGLAAQGGLDANADTNATVKAGGAKIGVNTGASLKSKFNALDSDGNGAISRSEASGNARLQSMFDSVDTDENIEDDAKGADVEGITYKQFKAGMQAKAQSGVVGSAVSKGKARVVDEGKDASNAGSEAMNKAEGAGKAMHDNMKATGDKMKDKAHDAGSDAMGKAGASADAMGEAAGQSMSGSGSAEAGASVDGGMESENN